MKKKVKATDVEREKFILFSPCKNADRIHIWSLDRTRARVRTRHNIYVCIYIYEKIREPMYTCLFRVTANFWVSRFVIVAHFSFARNRCHERSEKKNCVQNSSIFWKLYKNSYFVDLFWKINRWFWRCVLFFNVVSNNTFERCETSIEACIMGDGL